MIRFISEIDYLTNLLKLGCILQLACNNNLSLKEKEDLCSYEFNRIDDGKMMLKFLLNFKIWYTEVSLLLCWWNSFILFYSNFLVYVNIFNPLYTRKSKIFVFVFIHFMKNLEKNSTNLKINVILVLCNTEVLRRGFE